MAQVSYGTITITDITDIDSIVNYYLATDLSSGITKNNPASGHGTWTTDIREATLTNTFQYLWNYEKILGTGDVEISSTDPVIIGRYGVDGNSITSIDEYYQITNSTSNPGSSGWSKNTLVVPTSTKKYLWNYQVIHYSKTVDEGSYSDARIIGVYGDKGERGTSILKVTTQPTTTSGTAGGFSYSYRMPLSTVINESGKTEVLKGDIVEYNSNHYQVGYVNSSYVYLGPVTSIKGADSTQYYVFIRYSANSNGSGYVATPTSSTKYIGVYMGTSSSPPAYNNSGWTWSKYVGESATQYYAFVKYATDANGTNMQNTPASGYDYVGTYTGTKANPVASDFNWSKYTGEPGTPATQYYAFIKYATSSSGANMTDTPTTSTKYVGTYSGTKSNPTASDYKWSEYVGTDGVSVTSVRELYWLKTNSTNPSQITWNSSTSQPSQTIYSTDRTNSWTSTVPTYVTNGTYYTCVETSLSNNTKVWSAPVQNIALTNANSKATEALEKSTLAIGQVTNLDNRLKAFFWPGDSSYSGAFAVAKTSDDGLDITDANTYGFNTRVATGLVSIGYNKIPLSEWGISEGLKMYYPILNNGSLIDNKLGMQLTANTLNLYNPTLSYTEYNGKTENENPQELRLYEYSTSDNVYILTTDTTFHTGKTYYENDIIKGLEIDGTGMTIYDTDEKSIITAKNTIFSLGFDLAELSDNFDPYSAGNENPFIVWKKKENINYLYEFLDDIIIKDSQRDSQRYSLKQEIDTIENNIATNANDINNIITNHIPLINNNISRIDNLLNIANNNISTNISNISTNANNISMNASNITIINARINKMKAYWKIDTNNHLILIEEGL